MRASIVVLRRMAGWFAWLPLLSATAAEPVSQLTRLTYNQPDLVVDLGIGLWGTPLPVPGKQAGLTDLMMVCPRPFSNGVFYFENTGLIDSVTGLPIFKPGLLQGPATASLATPDRVIYPQISYLAEGPAVSSAGLTYPDFFRSGFAHPKKMAAPQRGFPGIRGQGSTWHDGVRANQWRLVDFDGDGKVDLVVGIEYWGDYNWENLGEPGKSAYDERGRWRAGPLHGYVYWLRNLGTNRDPVYGPPERILAGGSPIDTYGMPSPCVADFRGSGKLDIICGEFLDGFTYFENTGTRTHPVYAAGRRLSANGRPIAMVTAMITPTACDFWHRGRIDLVVGDEDGRAALVENTGRVVDGVPQFLPPRYFRQYAAEVKFGALSAPAAGDLFGHGRDDLVVGDAAGYIGLIKNLGGNPPRWAAPVYLSAGGEVIRIQAGPSGSPQGPSEAKWGYLNVRVADWDGDGRLDILASDIWGRVTWYRNIGSRTEPRFAAGRPIEVAWPGPTPKPAWNWWQPRGQELVTEWRSTPYAVDWNGDGLCDLVMIDAEGYLSLFPRRRDPDGTLKLLPGQRIFWSQGASSFDSGGKPLNQVSGPLRLNGNPVGASGRRTYCFTDWDGDGTLDLLVNGKPNIDFFRGLGRDKAGRWWFKNMGPVDPLPLAGHSTAPTIVHWAGGRGDLVFGAEDGFLYYLRAPAPAASSGK